MICSLCSVSRCTTRMVRRRCSCILQRYLGAVVVSIALSALVVWAECQYYWYMRQITVAVGNKRLKMPMGSSVEDVMCQAGITECGRAVPYEENPYVGALVN